MKFSYTSSTAVPSVAIEALTVEVAPYIDHLRKVAEAGDYQALESSVNVPQDEFMLRAVERAVDKFASGELRTIFVIGIGGSNLGTKAIYDAMAGARDLVPHQLPRLIFVDTTDASLLTASEALINRADSAKELLFIVISKSGTTTETVYNAEVLLAAFAKRFGRNASRVVVMSQDGSPLLTAAAREQMYTIPLPPQVGGRYSVLSPVGLLPLALLGLSPRDLRAGAHDQLMASLHPDATKSAPAISAVTQFYFYRQGIKQHDTFVFSPRLESLGKWYRQLLAESIGKTTSDANQTAVGITPTVSVGSTDLHSVGQLYLGGPRDRVTTFVDVTKPTGEGTMPSDRAWPDVVPVLRAQTADQVMGAIFAGTKAAYNTNRLPFMTISLEGITLYELGAFMQFKMCEVMMLGHLLKVNPFDQPHVEQYKTVTKQILEG